MGISGHLVWLLKNLYDSQQSRMKDGTNKQFKAEKRGHWSYIRPSCFINLHSEHIVINVGLEEIEIKMSGSNSNKHWYVVDIILMAGSE